MSNACCSIKGKSKQTFVLDKDKGLVGSEATSGHSDLKGKKVDKSFLKFYQIIDKE